MPSDSIQSDSAPTQKIVEELAAEACLSLFDAYGVPLTSALEGTSTSEVSMTGVVGFSGPGISGMCLLAASNEPIKASNPTDGSPRDWIAELVNQLAGRLKHKLIGRGAAVYVTTPIVLRGARIEPMPRKQLTPQLFSGAGGMLCLWVEVETAKGFALTREATEETAMEGDTLLF